MLCYKRVKRSSCVIFMFRPVAVLCRVLFALFRSVYQRRDTLRPLEALPGGSLLCSVTVRVDVVAFESAAAACCTSCNSIGRWEPAPLPPDRPVYVSVDKAIISWCFLGTGAELHCCSNSCPEGALLGAILLCHII